MTGFLSKSQSELVDVLRFWASGDLAEDIAVMRLILLAPGDAEPRALLDDAIRAAALRVEDKEALFGLAARASSDDQAWATVRATVAAVPHDQAISADVSAEVRRVAARFDAAAKVSPEASVALYSLGDRRRLEAATDEIANQLIAWGLLGATRRLLDIGCGIGRLERALSGRIGEIVGCDVSAEMIAIAEARCAGLDNVSFRLTNGLDLADFAGASFDTVLAVDVFPYLVAAGGDLAARHIGESARVLKSRGSLIILNYSYRGSVEQDDEEIARWGTDAGLAVVESASRPFRLWDGIAFVLRKPAVSSN